MCQIRRMFYLIFNTNIYSQRLSVVHTACATLQLKKILAGTVPRRGNQAPMGEIKEVICFRELQI